MPQPDNPKLWNTLGRQAMAKYPSQRTAGLSGVAGRWRQAQYVEQGGGFVQSIKQVDPKKRDVKQEAVDKSKRQKKAAKNKIKKAGFVA